MPPPAPPSPFQQFVRSEAAAGLLLFAAAVLAFAWAIAGLAFGPGPLLDSAKLAVLSASLVSAAAGAVMLSRVLRWTTAGPTGGMADRRRPRRCPPARPLGASRPTRWSASVSPARYCARAQARRSGDRLIY